MAKAYVIGTCDTKRAELQYLRELLDAAGVATVLVDVGPKSRAAGADVSAQDVAACHPGGAAAVSGLEP